MMKHRNSIIYVIGKVAGLLAFVVAHFGWFHIAPEYQGWVEMAAVFIGGGSAALGQSPLPSSQSADQQIEWKRLIVDAPIKPSPGPIPATPGTLGR